jgi:hypothetical protein
MHDLNFDDSSQGSLLRHQEHLGNRLSTVTLKVILAVIAVYLFLCGFIFATCILMSNSNLSPETSIDFIHHPARSILLIVCITVPFALMLMVGRGGFWAWVCLRFFAGVLTIFGIYALLAPHGHFEGFTGAGSLRRGSGIVYAASSIVVLLITTIPGLRQRFNEGL